MKDEFEKMIGDPRGWITDKGVCFWSSMYQHVEILEDKVAGNNSYSWISKECDRWNEEKDAESMYFEEQSEEYGNSQAEWHIYEIWLDNAEPDFRKKFTKMLYDKGWVRVGNSERLLSFEGTQKGLLGNDKVIKDIIEVNSFDEIDVREV